MNPISYENPEEKIKQLEEEIVTLKRRIISQDKMKKDLSILIVDDEPNILEAGKKYMQRFGYRVITAENGREAINKYKKYPIHLVVLDIGLPDMNGLSCFKMLRSINQNANIVISTGSDINRDRKEFSDLGAAAFLQKPYSLNQLLDTTKRILYGQSM